MVQVANLTTTPFARKIKDKSARLISVMCQLFSVSDLQISPRSIFKLVYINVIYAYIA